MRIGPSTPARGGNALIIAFGLALLAAALITASTTGSVQVLTDTGHRTHQLRAIAAVEAVLQRREAVVAAMAQDGSLRTWTGRVGETANLGRDFFSDCEVRWKIEPSRTVHKNDIGAAVDINYITNPSPDANFQPTADGEQPNEAVYLYRVAAEARLPGPGPDGISGNADDQPIAAAQGVRYVSVNEEPLFRYVIFYAKNGLKGDLELTHGPGVNIAGSVYSNGAIYLGSGAGGNHWDALNPALAGPTTIGPDSNGAAVSVIAVDGLFRLSKQTLYGVFNGNTMGGTNPGFTKASGYTLTGTFPSDPPGIDLTTVDTATRDGTWINPYRIIGAPIRTIGPARTINGNAVLGLVSPTSGNDSRDNERSTSHKWNSGSLGAAPQGFAGLVRSRVTNARIKSLPTILQNRPLETQALAYDEGGATDDLADDEDEHLEAQPLFLRAGQSDSTAVIADAATPSGMGPTEFPGQYLRYAFGTNDAYFARKSPYTGWSPVSRAGDAITSLPQRAGLIIRERPRPDWTYAPTSVEANPASIGNRAYVPFAYGKHKYPSIWPFTELWVSDAGSAASGGNFFARTIVPTNTNSQNTTSSQQWYDFGGSVTVIDGTDADGEQRDQSPADQGYVRNNWRLINLKNSNTVRAGNALTGATNDTGFYFNRDEFQSLQMRISRQTGGNGTTNIDGRKLGIMLRPVNNGGTGVGGTTDLRNNGFNARDPYAAMLFSPERGFFAERRRERADLLNVPAYYTGTTLDTNGQDIDSFGNTTAAAGDNAAISLVAGSNFVGTQQLITTSRQFSSSSGPGSTSIDAGEGAFSFAIGPYTRSSWYRKNATRNNVVFEVTVNTPRAGAFVTAAGGDDNRVFRIFNTAALTTASWTSGGSGWSNVDVTTATNARFTWSATTTVNGTSNSFGQARRYTDNGLVATTTGMIIRTINGGFQGQYSAARADWLAANPSLNESNFVAALATKGYIVVNYSDADFTALPPAVADPIHPASPANPMSTSPRPKFSLERGGYVDINPWISARGTWFPTPGTPIGELRHLPNLNLGSSTPKTQSFEPRYWTGVAPPAAGAAANGPECSIVPNTTATGGPASGALWEDVQPTTWTASSPTSTGNCAWVRIERIASGSTQIRFKYYWGTGIPPADDASSRIWPNWQILRNPATVAPTTSTTTADSEITENMATWSSGLLIGICAQSGQRNTLMTSVVDQITLATGAFAAPTYTGLTPAGNVSWETITSPNLMTQYLCSQYQVFLGPQEITEDFFLYGENAPTTRLAQERWFYNTREFWSQSRWFNEGDGARATWIEKESGLASDYVANLSDHDVRRLWARSTMLDINLANLQSYLRARTVAQATTDRIATGTPPMPAMADTGLLRTRFNGTFYFARTNRYPWNPTSGATNPFNPDLPNTSNNFTNITDVNFTFVDTVNRPPCSPPIKPADFHHGVMISDASAINWDIDAGGIQAFGISKTTIATPGQLFIRGNLNSIDQLVTHGGVSGTAKTTPLAIMADAVTLLSNAWDPVTYQDDLLTVANATSPPTTGILGRQFGTAATSTTYRAAIVTNNQPTTKSRAYQGESAAFINTMLFLENWVGQTMSYTGSLVVLDTCRTTRAFLLDSPKTYGRTPFGTMGWHIATPDWSPSGGAIAVYNPGTRSFTFNEDFLTEQGTPPNTPFGLTASGVGGWVRPTR